MVAEHVFAVGNVPSTKEMVGVVSKPKVGGTSAPVANAKTLYNCPFFNNGFLP